VLGSCPETNISNAVLAVMSTRRGALGSPKNLEIFKMQANQPAQRY